MKPIPRNPEERQPILLARKKLKMAESVQAYVRGNVEKFYEWFEGSQERTIPQGPAVWICGDCHIGNLGPVGDTDERVHVRVRDLDQAVIGNPALDLVRLALSLAMAARESDLPGVTIARLLEEMLVGYEAALLDSEQGRRDGDEDAKRPEAIRFVVKRALRRSWKDLFEERLEGTSPSIPLGRVFWPLTKSERTAVQELFAAADVRRLVTLPSGYEDGAPIELIDAAYWMKGCSSLGRLRIAVLVRVQGASKGKGKVCLIDIKEATKPMAPRYQDASMPRSNADRVVAGAEHLVPALGKRMLGARLLDRSVFLRELLPQDLKVDLAHLSRDEAKRAARYLAGVVGGAHARQMDASERRAWKRELEARCSKSLHAPSWLWTSMVELVALHEAAYLEHCRKYALEPLSP